jgi:hypothetical protein
MSNRLACGDLARILIVRGGKSEDFRENLGVKFCRASGYTAEDMH